MLVLVGGAVALSSGCGGREDEGTIVRPGCDEAWNAPGNEANRKLVADSGGAAWSVEVSGWTGISDPVPGSDVDEDDLRQEGCGYVFFTLRLWMSLGGEWDESGSLRWQEGIARGVRGSEQRQFETTATVSPGGTIH
jgi:hypothetical protein